MKKISITFLACILLAIAAQTGFAQSEKENVIKTARAFETAPLAKETKEMYKKAFVWIAETDQVTVGLCGGVVGLFTDKKYKNMEELLSAYEVGMAAFKLENPGKASDEMTAQVVGVQTVLKTYQAIMKEKPKAKSETIDALLAKNEAGELEALIKTIDCGRR